MEIEVFDEDNFAQNPVETWDSMSEEFKQIIMRREPERYQEITARYEETKKKEVEAT